MKTITRLLLLMLLFTIAASASATPIEYEILWTLTYGDTISLGGSGTPTPDTTRFTYDPETELFKDLVVKWTYWEFDFGHDINVECGEGCGPWMMGLFSTSARTGTWGINSWSHAPAQMTFGFMSLTGPDDGPSGPECGWPGPTACTFTGTYEIVRIGEDARAVPEPVSAALLGVGGIGLGLMLITTKRR